MNYRLFEVFHAVMLSGTVSGAAAELGVSQPSVTKSIKQLETELGYLLFDRISGRLQPTPAALVLLKETERARSAFEDLTASALRLRSGASRHLRIVTTPALGLDIVPDAVMAFRSTDPDMRFTISTRHSGEVLSEISRPAYGFDMGLVFDASTRSVSVGAIPIGQVPVVCVSKRGTLGNISAEELGKTLFQHELVALEATEPLGRMLAEIGVAAGWRGDPLIRVQTYQMACSLARRGAGLAIVDAMSAIHAAEHDPGIDLHALPKALTLPVNMVYPLGKGLDVPVRALIDDLSASLRKRLAVMSRRMESR